MKDLVELQAEYHEAQAARREAEHDLRMAEAKAARARHDEHRTEVAFVVAIKLAKAIAADTRTG